MPTYRFVIDAGDREAEEYGVEMTDDASARAESIRLAGDVLRFETKTVLQNRLVRVRVLNEDSQAMFLVTILATESGKRQG